MNLTKTIGIVWIFASVFYGYKFRQAYGSVTPHGVEEWYAETLCMIQFLIGCVFLAISERKNK